MKNKPLKAALITVVFTSLYLISGTSKSIIGPSMSINNKIELILIFLLTIIIPVTLVAFLTTLIIDKRNNLNLDAKKWKRTALNSFKYTIPVTVLLALQTSLWNYAFHPPIYYIILTGTSSLIGIFIILAIPIFLITMLISYLKNR